MKATCIIWDVEDNDLRKSLPREIELPEELTDKDIDFDGIENYLSSQTGFCVFSYTLEEK